MLALVKHLTSDCCGTCASTSFAYETELGFAVWCVVLLGFTPGAHGVIIVTSTAVYRGC